MNKTLLIINYIALGVIFVVNIFICVYFFNTNKTQQVFDENILKVVEIKTTNDGNAWGYATGFFL